jgi:hypothetical protein
MAAVRGGTATADDFSVIETHVQGLMSESIGHRKNATELKATAEKYGALSKTLSEGGLNLESDLSAQLAALKGIPGQKDDEISKLRAEHGRKFAELEAKEKAATERARKKGAEAELIPELDKIFLKGSVAFKALSFDGLISYDETDDHPYITLEGVKYRGSEAAAKLKDHPDYKDMVKNVQSGGGGSRPAPGGAKNTLSQSDFTALSPRAQAKWYADGNSVTPA